MIEVGEGTGIQHETGLEPVTTALGGQHAIHCATRARVSVLCS